jgi:hypothetical protein
MPVLNLADEIARHLPAAHTNAPAVSVSGPSSGSFLGGLFGGSGDSDTA